MTEKVGRDKKAYIAAAAMHEPQSMIHLVDCGSSWIEAAPQ